MSVVFTAGNTPDNAFATWMLWRRWAMEENGVRLDSEGFMDHWMTLSNSGEFVQMVGWDGIEPVAMMAGRVLVHPVTGERSVYGDNTYVAPTYRKGGVMRAMLDFGIATARLIGMRAIIAPVTAGTGATAAFLGKVYADAGFELSGLTMTRRT